MKTRTILFLAISAVATLSFTVVTVKSLKHKEAPENVVKSADEPIGGFTSESRL